MSAGDLVRYRSATELVRVWQEASRRVERAFAEVSSAEDLLIEHFARDARDDNPRTRGLDMRIAQRDVYFDNPARTLKKLRHDVWSRLIDQLGVRQFLSVRAAEELSRQIRDELMPEITEETVRDLGESFRSQIGELHAEAVREVFEFLRPGHWTKLKTNKRNEWQLTEKVILEGWLEDTRRWFTGYHLAHYRYSAATALENVLRALDGKGMVQKTYRSQLELAIDASGTEGVGETEYLTFKCFRNRNLHIRFKRPDLVRRLNQIAGGKRLRQTKGVANA